MLEDMYRCVFAFAFTFVFIADKRIQWDNIFSRRREIALIGLCNKLIMSNRIYLTYLLLTRIVIPYQNS